MKFGITGAFVAAARIKSGCQESVWAAAVDEDPSAEQTDESPHAGAVRDEMEELRRILLKRDQALLERDSAVMAKKYARMTSTPFAFFRGTRWLAPDEPSAFRTGGDPKIALVGDPHPENVTIRVAPDGSNMMEFNDFDLATYGSYLDDLRRLAVGTWVVGDMANLRRIQIERSIRDLIGAYVAEVHDLVLGRSRSRPNLPRHLGENLDSILVPTGSSNDVSKDRPASAEEVALARKAVLAALRPERADSQALRIKSVTRRNAGVASFALLRLHVTVEEAVRAGHDEQRFEVKESVAPSARVAAEIEAQFRDQADSHVRGWAVVDGREYHVRPLADGTRISASHLAKAIEDGQWSEEQFDELAASLGRLLAYGHCTSRDPHGTRGVQMLGKAVESLGALETETVGYAHRAAVINKNHYHMFRRLLRERGSLIGWTAPAVSSPPLHDQMHAAETVDQAVPLPY